MKITKKIVWSLFLFGHLCTAQLLLEKLAVFQESATVFNNMQYSIDGIDGHQYFLDDWGTGKLIINDSIINFQARIQFDMVSGEPIIGNTSDKKKGFILRDKSVTGFVINNTNFIKIPSSMFLKEVKRNYFVTPLLTKSNQLLISYLKILKEPYILKNTYSDGNSNRKYITLKRFYVLNKNNKYIAVKLKKKAILAALSDKEVALKKYVKTQGLSYKKENDVAALLAYYHSL